MKKGKKGIKKSTKVMIGVAGAAVYGAMTFGFLGLCIGLGAGLLAASGIMTVAEMAKDIRRIRKMMEED